MKKPLEVAGHLEDCAVRYFRWGREGSVVVAERNCVALNETPLRTSGDAREALNHIRQDFAAV